MPDPAPRLERWRWLGRLLPDDVRERVFDPAFSDLLRAWLTESGHTTTTPFALHALGTYVGCVPFAVPRLFVRRGRLTRFGKVVAWTAVVLFLASVAWMRTTGAYNTDLG